MLEYRSTKVFMLVLFDDFSGAFKSGFAALLQQPHSSCTVHCRGEHGIVEFPDILPNLFGKVVVQGTFRYLCPALALCNVAVTENYLKMKQEMYDLSF